MKCKLSHKTIKKIGVYFILGMFLLSTALMSAMYFFDMNQQVAQTETGAVETTTQLTGSVGTGS